MGTLDDRPTPTHHEHDHVYRVVYRDENDDRIRTLESCNLCPRQRRGCLAKRLADDADESGNREAWGPVGAWTYYDA